MSLNKSMTADEIAAHLQSLPDTPMTERELADDLFQIFRAHVAEGGQTIEVLALLLGQIMGAIPPKYRRKAWNRLKRRTLEEAQQ